MTQAVEPRRFRPPPRAVANSARLASARAGPRCTPPRISSTTPLNPRRATDTRRARRPKDSCSRASGGGRASTRPTRPRATEAAGGASRPHPRIPDSSTRSRASASAPSTTAPTAATQAARGEWSGCSAANTPSSHPATSAASLDGSARCATSCTGWPRSRGRTRRARRCSSGRR